MEKKQEITFKLVRLEDLNESEKLKVEGLDCEFSSGLIIKEYKSGSFVKLRRYVPLNNSFVQEVKRNLSDNNRKIITKRITESLLI